VYILGAICFAVLLALFDMFGTLLAAPPVPDQFPTELPTISMKDGGRHIMTRCEGGMTMIFCDVDVMNRNQDYFIGHVRASGWTGCMRRDE
jgi:hypothetical protein